MNRSTTPCQHVCLVLAIYLFSSLPQLANASSGDPLAASLATEFVQSRAQISIFRHDDQIDVDCQNRRFVRSQIVNQPRVVDQSVNERKWLERWVLNRCGQEISYDVYFTVVGEGGAFFSFREADPNRAIYARTLRLHQPLMKGGDVRALQVALLSEGFKVATDGVFGPNTREAVIAYQKKNGLTADGIAGPATSARLGL